ncbi:helix-turn-helix transcriptional regulator [Thalassobaculum sp.]|uniref:AraC family transcriptional regulator n=1 Tax=Thalassobaculum sp. TaxID=2022740 RepID=UPI0032ECE69F
MIHASLYSSQPEDHPAPVVAYAGRQQKGSQNAMHSHWRAQLFHIVAGSVTVETERGSFVVPPERALWMPSNTRHGSTYHQDTSLRYLYFRPEVVAHLPRAPSVIRLSPLLRELVLAFMAYPREQSADGPAGRLAAVILDQLAAERASPLHLPMPGSERLRRAVAELAADPARADGLADVARRAALSERSFERHFRAETGLSYRAWLRQARLMKAVEWLSLGTSVGEVADRLGYEGPSAFVAGFRKAFGVTPGRYFDEIR